MKIKITILTENDIPASALNGIDEEQIKSAWQSFLDLISVMPTENNDRATVLSAEFVEEEAVKELPSAQPKIEERKEESAQNVPKEDLISRNAAIDAINKALDRETLLNSFVRKVAVDALKTMPSAEPEIVRCKDCQHFRTYYHGTESDTAITHACVWFLDREMGLEDYCSKGVFR